MRLIARLAVVICLVGALGLSAAFRFSTERMWWVELVRYVPYPAYLVPAVAALALSWVLTWRWRVAAAVALALVLTQVMGLALGWSDDGSSAFRFMTYNVKAYLASGRPDGFARLAWEIAQHDPDVLVMQDAGRIADDITDRPADPAAPVPTEMVALRAALAHRHLYADGQFVVASRFPLLGCQPGDIAPQGRIDNYVHCTIDVNGNEIDLFTAHFVSPREGLNAARYEHSAGMGEWEENFAERLWQVRKLAEDVSRSTRPVIVAGDLNAENDSPVVKRLLAVGLRDAFASAGVGYGYSYGHDLKPGIDFLRIDHVLVSRTIGVRDCDAGNGEASQHRPVIADLFAHRR